MGKKIRDTIHGYIYVTKVEEAVSQHPLFLRLHYVHQTSFTYLTYPNAHSTRYPHSLGVMHVAGEIFASALRNSVSAVTQDLASAVRVTLGRFQSKFDELGDADGELFSKIVDEALTCDLLSDPIYAISGAPRFEPSISMPGRAQPVDANVFVPLVLLYQATRLAALLHDIGHPPFSHIVEYALLDVLPQRYAGHEPRGLDLVDEIINSEDLAGRRAFIDYPYFSRASLYLCRYILSKEDRNSPFIGIKSSLLDGPIDADRLDYVRRDAYSAGMVPTYDIRRLVDAAFFRKKDSRYEVGYQPNCLSAFENFFVARYDLYRWMIYHHDVARRNLSIQRVIKIIVNPESNVSPFVKRIGEEFATFAAGHAKYYRRFVDSYLLDKFWTIYEHLEENMSTGEGSLEPRLKFFLDVVLARRNDMLRTLFKRPDDYGLWVNTVLAGRNEDLPTDVQKSSENVKQFNALLLKKFKEVVADCGGNPNVAKVRFGELIEQAIRAEMETRDAVRQMRVYAYYFGTFQAGPDRPDALGEEWANGLYFSTPKKPDKRIMVRSVSPTLSMLQEAWAFSPQLLIFYNHPLGTALMEDDHGHDMLKESVRDGLRAYVGLT